MQSLSLLIYLSIYLKYFKANKDNSRPWMRARLCCLFVRTFSIAGEQILHVGRKPPLVRDLHGIHSEFARALFGVAPYTGPVIKSTTITSSKMPGRLALQPTSAEI